MTPAQCRAARALLDLHVVHVADAAGVAHTTVSDFENATRKPRQSSIEKIRKALELSGIKFIDSNGGGPGVRLKNESDC